MERYGPAGPSFSLPFRPTNDLCYKNHIHVTCLDTQAITFVLLPLFWVLVEMGRSFRKVVENWLKTGVPWQFLCWVVGM